jgi:hypothetical protein
MNSKSQRFKGSLNGDQLLARVGNSVQEFSKVSSGVSGACFAFAMVSPVYKDWTCGFVTLAHR